MSSRRPKREPWHPALYEDYDVYAIQALARGEASEAQQKRALDWIIKQAAATYENGFVANDHSGRIGAFVDGRQFVGQQIVKFVNFDTNLLTKVMNG